LDLLLHSVRNGTSSVQEGSIQGQFQLPKYFAETV